MPYVTSWERIAKREGKREGKEEEQREVALKMLQDGVSIDKIASYTGLTEKKVKIAGQTDQSFSNIKDPAISPAILIFPF